MTGQHSVRCCDRVFWEKYKGCIFSTTKKRDSNSFTICFLKALHRAFVVPEKKGQIMPVVFFMVFFFLNFHCNKFFTSPEFITWTVVQTLFVCLSEELWGKADAFQAPCNKSMICADPPFPWQKWLLSVGCRALQRDNVGAGAVLPQRGNGVLCWPCDSGWREECRLCEAGWELHTCPLVWGWC